MDSKSIVIDSSLSVHIGLVDTYIQYTYSIVLDVMFARDAVMLGQSLK